MAETFQIINHRGTKRTEVYMDIYPQITQINLEAMVWFNHAS